LALIAHVASFKSRVPLIHFFDGMQVSHQINNVEVIDKEIIKKLIPKEAVYEHQRRALNPTHPHRAGSSVSGDVYFQMSETVNPYIQSFPAIMEETMREFAKETGREYHLFEYVGAPDAEDVIVIMGASALTSEETARYLNSKGDKVGVVKVRLYRPWSAKHFIDALPKSVKRIAVLDRVKEAPSIGEPLYCDVCTTLMENGMGHVKVIGGRYGIAGKAFTPAMMKAVLDNLREETPKNHFTVGIVDDVTNTSLKVGPNFSTIPDTTKQCIFFALGSDGTVGANKNAIKIIGDNTDLYAQAYFFYSAHKSGSTTVSHLRFGPEKITAQYPINAADYVACHNKAYMTQFNVLKSIKEGGTFVLNSPWTLEMMENILPNRIKKIIAQKKVKFYNIDANQIAHDLKLGGRINMIMQTVFFKLVNLFSEKESIDLLKHSVEKAYGSKGQTIVDQNKEAIDTSLENLKLIDYPESWADLPDDEVDIDTSIPQFVRDVQKAVIRREGDSIPVSKFSSDGRTLPGSANFEKRTIAEMVPKWNATKCTQCNICSLVCPHSAIRPFILNEEEMNNAPKDFEVQKLRGKQEGFFSIQVSPMDCTGCTACTICPSKALEMVPISEVIESGSKNWEYAKTLEIKDYKEDKVTVKGTQFKFPYLEFSGACAGCGQTPYVKLVTQLFGDRMIIANATGCSSVWGSYYPSNPFTVDCNQNGPAYSRALFETNGEYGFGMSVATTQRRNYVAQLIEQALKDHVPMSKELHTAFDGWLKEINDPTESTHFASILKKLLESEYQRHPQLTEIYKYSDMFVKPSHWIIGGDGWAYDIGFGGLDHILAQGRNVNVLVLDNEEYANTGGQQSKSTPMGAMTKFANGGKRIHKKDLGLIAMTYGNIYVASVCMGASHTQLVKALMEAESYDGPSLIIAYCPCVDHGIQGGLGLPGVKAQKEAVKSGYWPLYRYDPRLKKEGKNPFQLDSPLVRSDLKQFLKKEARYKTLHSHLPEVATQLQKELEDHVIERFDKLKMFAGLEVEKVNQNFEE
jgi:pyruvate-ferredoxin/flavodoxin oxidoreductase